EARWLRVGLDGGARVAEELGQLTLVAIGVGGGELETVRGKPGTVDPAVDLVAAGQQLDFLELAVLDLGDELGKPDLFGAGELIEPPLRHDGEQHYGEPVNEQGSNGPIHDHLEGRWPQAVMSWYGMTLPRGTLGEPNLEPRAPTGGVGDRDFAPIGVHQRLHQVQADPGSGVVAVQPDEPLEDPIPVGGRHPRSSIRHGEHRLPRVFGDLDRDERSAGAVDGGVVDQVGDHPMQAEHVAFDHHRLLDSQREPVGGETSAGHVDDLRGDLRQVDRFQVEAGLAEVDATEVDKLRDEIGEALRLGGDEPDRFGRHRIQDDRVELFEDASESDDAGERGTHVVSDADQEVRALPLGPVELADAALDAGEAS